MTPSDWFRDVSWHGVFEHITWQFDF